MDHTGQPARTSRIRRGFSLRVLLIVVPVLVAVPAIAWKFLPGRSASLDLPEVIWREVQRGDFVHVISERGNVESAKPVEIRCEVQSLNTAGTRIIQIVPEGTEIVEGGPYLKPKDGGKPEPLVVLDSSALENDRIKQESACNTSLAALIQAQSDLDAAKIAKEEYFGKLPPDPEFYQFAKAAVQAASLHCGNLDNLVLFSISLMNQGKYFLDENTIKSEIDVAQENLRRARDTERYSEQLEARGYITKVQLEADRFARQKAEKDLEAALKKLEVLQNYTKRKMKVQLEADIRSAEAKFRAQEATHELDNSKLAQIKKQIENCTIYAPGPGQVVYAHLTERWGGQEMIIEEGALIRERQVIIRLPNPNEMQVKAKVNEAKIALVREGQPAVIRLDAFQDQQLRGVVEKVNEYPAPGAWWGANIKEYETSIRILESPVLLRSGYTAVVDILVDQRSDVLQVPVQAVIENGQKHYCVVRTETGFEPREVQIGPSNDNFVVILNGLQEGEQVAMLTEALRSKITLPEPALDSPPTALLAAVAPERPNDPTKASPERSESGPGGGPLKANRPADELARSFDQIDRNGDGQLQEEELPGSLQPYFGQADTNGDLQIDRGEWAAAQAAVRRLSKAKRPQSPGPQPDGSRRMDSPPGGRTPRGKR
ncbi:MAG: HlyD family efflux transporter periplasmic adaptor subunit [Thermoguttaceae bacterium]